MSKSENSHEALAAECAECFNDPCIMTAIQQEWLDIAEEICRTAITLLGVDPSLCVGRGLVSRKGEIVPAVLVAMANSECIDFKSCVGTITVFPVVQDPQLPGVENEIPPAMSVQAEVWDSGDTRRVWALESWSVRCYEPASIVALIPSLISSVVHSQIWSKRKVLHNIVKAWGHLETDKPEDVAVEKK